MVVLRSKVEVAVTSYLADKIDQKAIEPAPEAIYAFLRYFPNITQKYVPVGPTKCSGNGRINQ